MTTFTEPKFPCGVLLATPGASEAFERNRQSILDFVKRHLLGDWGEELCEEDKHLNDQSLVDGSRLLSAYKTRKGKNEINLPLVRSVIAIITGASRNTVANFASPNISQWTNNANYTTTTIAS